VPLPPSVKVLKAPEFVTEPPLPFKPAMVLVVALISRAPPLTVTRLAELKLLVAPNWSVPAWMVTAPVKRGFATPNFRIDPLLLFSVIPVTLLPMPRLIVVVPLPDPELVMVPVLLTAVVDNVIVPFPVPLLSVRLPEPVTPPFRVSKPESEEIVAAVPSTMGVEAVLFPLTFSKAPVAPVAPVPEIVTVFVPTLVKVPCSWAVAPLATVMALLAPKAVRFW